MLVGEFPTTRGPVVVWVSDLRHSSAALNSKSTFKRAENFLLRYHWLGQQVAFCTGAALYKWTGDGFLAGYVVRDEQDFARTSNTIVGAAWHLSYLLNVTSLAVSKDVFLKVGHGIAYDDNALIVNSGEEQPSLDVIGRGVVLGARLAGVPATFPYCLVDGHVVRAARKIGEQHGFRKREFSEDQVRRLFKGERRGTSDVYQMLPTPRRRAPVADPIAEARRVVASIDKKQPPSWIPLLVRAMDHGPDWARQIKQDWIAFTRVHMLAVVASIDRVSDKQVID